MTVDHILAGESERYGSSIVCYKLDMFTNGVPSLSCIHLWHDQGLQPDEQTFSLVLSLVHNQHDIHNDQFIVSSSLSRLLTVRITVPGCVLNACMA